MSITRHLRISNPHPNIIAFYDGRVEGHRFSPEPNWVDSGALALGIASYAIVSGNEALVYDTHISNAHAAAIRSHLEAIGISKFTVVYSHWHLDHVAGTEVFKDCTIISNSKTYGHLTAKKSAIEYGTLEGLPVIAPLILPTKTFSERLMLTLGNTEVELIECNIHSDDATVVWLPAQRILLAGDTLEDTITYVGEPEHLATHVKDLAQLAALNPRHILPNHGDPDILAAGGYPVSFITATSDYVTKLIEATHDETLATLPLQAFIAPQIEAGSLHYFAPYEEVHRSNIEMLRLDFAKIH
jgi:cyclase